MQRTMDQFHLMSVFVAVGDRGSFSAASRQLDMAPSSVTRSIAALEKQLGVKLIDRTTRNMRLTDAGVQYLEDCRCILASVQRVNESVKVANTKLSGLMSVTAPVLFGRSLVMPCIVDYMQAHPDVNVSAFFHDRLVNLVDEGIDVAVRIGELPDSGLKALRIGDVRRVLCASPAYLEKYGAPEHPQDLVDHHLIAASAVSPDVDWRFKAADIRLTPRFTATSNDVTAIAAMAGLGIARFHHYQVTNELATGELCTVLDDYEEAPRPIHIVHRESPFGTAKVRTFIEMLAEHLRRHPGVT